LNTNQINYLNIGLMVLSAGFAYAWPFETFLFVYTVLGPLHYLTEISWLHERNYYTQGRFDYLFLLLAAVVLTLVNLQLLAGASKTIPEWATFAAFGAALVFILFKTPVARWSLVILIALAGYFVMAAPWMFLLFGIFVPTLIHVFIFTGCFILLGALKSRHISGFLSLAAFAAIALSFVWFHPEHVGYQVAPYVSNNYGVVQSDGSLSSPFVAVNYFFAKIFNLQGFSLPSASTGDYVATLNHYLYQNPTALALMSFIAFAYCYHYLNWFSKTSIIRWHEVPKTHMAVVIGIWLISLGLYAFNYSVGLRWLFFLSLAHVLLEFPLNHLTFLQIGKELGNRVRGKAASVESA
jgi:hypothetical protein